jgi:hypothetical protein
VFFAKAVLQAVLVVALGAADGGVFEGVDKGFALDVITLVCVVDRGLFGGGAVFIGLGVATTGPFAFFGALVGGFRAVV